MGEILIAARDITVTFGEADVVRNVSLELVAGEIHAIVGENGAGKSSVAKILAGVYQPRLGHVDLGGCAVNLRSPREGLLYGIGLIHQEPQTFPDLSVAENIFVAHHPRRAGRIDWAQVRSQAASLLENLGVDIPLSAEVGRLSVAQQQMVEVACTLSYNPKVWIFDETSAPLTPKEGAELFAVMRRLRDSGCAVAMVTHHLHEVFAVADRITVMRDGEVVARKAVSETSQAEIVRLMVGRDIEPHVASLSEPGAVILDVNNLSGPGFSDVTLRVRAGEIVALAGLIGAGRTELARVLFGLVKPTGGEATPAATNPRHAIRQGLALVPEDRQHDGLVRQHSIRFNATLATLPRSFYSEAALQEKTEKALDKLNVVCRSDQQAVGELSGGNQQKVVLGKWFATQPRVLILDEPTRGVDIGAKTEVHKLIREQAASGVAVLLISSDLPEVLALADRILVMRGGRLVAELPAETTEEAIMLAATGS